ncbi:Zinc transporter ZIP2 [Strongyloides ratti]|uniref:Zinc transporter ZIP2 n=1 Tax=Strongyloides ratti TaxID=34506 RepID=A0A090L411_STRRB|nr:Zinc transporter ZIP2 [Strongyloides ratti]CEF62842.1 Zinc transporter ZIP2 [Strongyloides ratti]
MFGLIISLFGVTIISGIIAAYVSKKTSKRVVTNISIVTTNRDAKILSLLSCFGGGVFYAVCFLDIFPHITELYEKLKGKIEYDIHLPVTQLLICFGFFFVYLIEEISIKLIGGNNHSHNHVSIDIQRPLNEERNSFIEMNSRRHSLKNNERRLSAQIVNVISTEDNSHNTSLFKAILFASIMSFHSILEGIALGVKDDSKSMLIMFGSLLIHKSIESFSVGLQVSKENSSKMKMIIITLLTYSFMTPLGAGIGAFLQNLTIDETTKISIILFLECLAAGTFIYVTFMEIIAIERENEHDSIQQLLAIIAGFVVITLLQIYTHPDY